MPNRLLPLPLLLLILSCAPPKASETATKEVDEIAKQETLDDSAWTAELLQFRTDKDEELSTSSTSPMAGIQYLKSEQRNEVFLNRIDNGFALETALSADTVIHFERREPSWYWQDQGHEQVICRIDDELVAAGSALESQALFEIDSFQLSFYASEDRVTLIVFDPERPEKLVFEHLLYFPANRSLAVDAELRRLQEPEEVVMLTSRNLEKTFYRFAKMHFEIDGTEQVLSAFKYALSGEGSDQLFIPFRDATSSHETYGAGRFLDIEEPDREHFELDFNRSFNPLCNYSPAYNCAIPPKENHLEVAIRAGELTYPH